MTRLEKLFTLLAVVAVVYMSLSDPWWYDNWLRVVIVLFILAVTATLAFLAGVSHGIKIASENANKTLSRALDEQALQLKRQQARRVIDG